MNEKILVTYASRTGSTAEVAQAIGATLRESGTPVDVLPMQKVRDLSAYRAVIAGSAIRKSQWLPEAQQFVEKFHADLGRKPFATFTVCITLAMSNTAQYQSIVTKWIEPVRVRVAPVSQGLFAGRLDFSKLPLNWDTFLLRMAVALGIFPRGDRRDWNAIRAWAASTRPLLLH
jgi:menaquinone-dependent protoporphyrinogen oxidase